MLKKAAMATMIAGLSAVILFGRDSISYIKTCGFSVRDAVKQEVPLEFELQRARDLVAELVPDIRDCMHAIAEQQVEIDHLEAAIDRKQSGLTGQESAILALREDLQSGQSEFVYASQTFSTDEVKRDLEKRFERFKTASASLEKDRKILAARQTAVEANQEQLIAMLDRKQELEVQLAQLEARLETIQAAESVSSLAIDDSRLTQARKLIDDLNQQLDVRERVLDSEGRFTGLIPVESEQDPTSDVTQAIDDYFGNPTEQEANLESEDPEA